MKKVRSIFKEFLNLSKIDRTFCIFDASSVEISLSHGNPACNTIPMSACSVEKTELFLQTCLIDLKISMFMIF